jgi:hypothetical protein
MVSGAGCSGAEVPFYRGSGRVSSGDNGQHRGRNKWQREGDLSVVKIRFNEGNGCGLMVEGGGGGLAPKEGGGLDALGAAVAQAGRQRSVDAVRRKKKMAVGP